MFLSGPTAQQVSTTVWGQAIRSLTNVGALVSASLVNQSLALTTIFSLAPAAGKIREVSVGVSLVAGGAGNVNIELFDGTNTVILATAAPAATAFVAAAISTPTVFVRINNTNNTNAAKYWVAIAEWTV